MSNRADIADAEDARMMKGSMRNGFKRGANRIGAGIGGAESSGADDIVFCRLKMWDDEEKVCCFFGKRINCLQNLK